MTDLKNSPVAITDHATVSPRSLKRAGLRRQVARSWQLYVMMIPPIIYAIVFLYLPLYGQQIAFKNFSLAKGITGSPWAGLKYLEQYFNSFQFWPTLKNTLILNFYALLALIPLPIVLALLLNSAKNAKFRKAIQLITYAPYFISTVVVVGMILILFAPNSGIFNQAIAALGLPQVDFLSNSMFRHTYVWSGAWQTLGYSAVIYLAALSGIDPELHEAAKVDGASLLKRMWYIDLRGILPVMITLLVLNMGSILSVGFEKVLLMQNPLNQSVSEVIDTYAYRVAFVSALPQYSYGTAIGLFKSAIALILLLTANWLARRVADESLF